jgi:hypothetical protein
VSKPLYARLTMLVSVLVSVLVLGAIGSAAQNDFFGDWSGTWEGGGSGGGGFELTLEKGKDGAPTGKVSVTGEPTYKATLKTVAFDGPKMTATYDFPADDSIEIALAATFDGQSVKGTWTARGKNGGSEMLSGGWTCKKK